MPPKIRYDMAEIRIEERNKVLQELNEIGSAMAENNRKAYQESFNVYRDGLVTSQRLEKNRCIYSPPKKRSSRVEKYPKYRQKYIDKLNAALKEKENAERWPDSTENS